MADSCSSLEPVDRIVGQILEAIHFAATKHKDQRRKDPEKTPYINHPIGVAYILLKEGGVYDTDVLQIILLFWMAMQAKTSLEVKGEISPSTCVYTSCYCEENVWKLCEQIRDEKEQNLSEYYSVFISNEKRQVPLWMQKSAKDPLAPVVWDYHVLLLRQVDAKCLIYDLDSILPFPCPFEQYVQQAIQNDRQLKKHFHRKFRVIPAEIFLSTFASDRSHMKKPNGEWVKPPPPYSPIRSEESTMNLQEFIDMSQGEGEGQVMDYKTFIKSFTSTE
ncbi:protein N-terminal glutamine amidohydrolase [Pocillopora verrucosa]|nr:protein N-terminal glutamine amidohydrolase-like [Pocillopora damicornis]XP_058972009.1 protein N-terminal glutamine amidohydrolase-like [Pocillopora verrucosa]